MNLYVLEMIRGNKMPILLVPLMINMFISGAIWMGEIAVTLKVVLTLATVVKFSLFTYAALFCQNKALKVGSFAIEFILNVLFIIFGLVHSMIGVVIGASSLIVMFFIWIILSRVFVKEEKEGSKS